LEEGNRRGADPRQIDLKHKNDPKGLLNPGKMIGWENPDYEFTLDSQYDYWAKRGEEE
jgi:hypothetical protein